MACVTKLLYETRVCSLFLVFKYAVSLFRMADEIFVSGNVAQDGIGSSVERILWTKWKEDKLAKQYLDEPPGGHRPFDLLKCDSSMRYYDNRFNLPQHQMRYVGYELVNLVVETEIRLTRAESCVSSFEIDS